MPLAVGLGTLWIAVAIGCAPTSAAQIEGDAGSQTAAADTAAGVKMPESLHPNQAGVDWPRFLGPHGDSTSPETGLTAPWPKEGLPLLWTQELGEGYAAPTIALGRLLLFGRFENTARLTCLDVESREELWRFEYETGYEDRYGYDGGPRCCPVVDGGRVYIHGVEGMLHCLELATGKMLWKIDEREDFGIVQNFFGVGSTPIVFEDKLIVAVGGSPPGSDQQRFEDVKGNGTGVVAFNKLTGEVVYKLSDELAAYASPVLATIEDRPWCFVFARGGLVAFDPRTGTEDFTFPWRARIMESVNAANPLVVGNQVLISECYGPGSALLKVKPGGYEVVWQDELRARERSLESHWTTPIHHEGYVYGVSGRHMREAELRCVELATGKVMWSEPDFTRGSLLKVDGYLIALTEVGELRLIRPTPEKYDEVSRSMSLVEGRDNTRLQRPLPLLRYPCWAAPVLSHGKLYVRGEGILACYRAMSE
jgi:outer membrane protein assembly factor BamB